MGHSQPPTPMATDKTVANRIVNGTAKQIIPRAVYIRFYWVRERIQQNNFHILWEEGKRNLADYFKKHHPIWHHRTIIPRYLKPTSKDIENSKYQKTGTGRGCFGTTNPRVIREPDNTLKGIRNQIIRNPDNPLKEIHNLVPNGIQSQWPRGLNVPT